jgi:hypothetical protein
VHIKKVAAVQLTSCQQDAWPNSFKTCLAQAKDETEMRECQPEQSIQDKMEARLARVMAEMQQEMQ